MRDQEYHKCGSQHLQAFPAGCQPEEQTGNSGQGEEEGQDAHNHTGDAVQEDADPLEQRHSQHCRKQCNFQDQLKDDHF